MSALQARKREIDQELVISQRAAARTLQKTSTEAKSLVVKDFILPAAGIAVAGYLAYRVATRNQTPAPAASASLNANTPPPRQSSPRKSSAYQSLLRLGSLLIPAGKAIFEIMQEERR